VLIQEQTAIIYSTAEKVKRKVAAYPQKIRAH